MDDDTIDTTVLECLKSLPVRTEMEKLRKIPEDEQKDLDPAEKFALVFRDIPRLDERLECMRAKHDFVWISDNVKSNMAIMTEAFEEIRTSKKFASLLELLLLTGNFMNANTRNANTHGFHLNVLLKLKDTKTLDGKLSMAHFLAEWVTDVFVEVSLILDIFL